MPRNARPGRPNAFEAADAYLHPGAIVVICAHVSRTWYEDRAFYTELLIWLEDHQVKPVVIASPAVHSAIKVAAEFGTSTDVVLLEENTKQLQSYCETASLGIAMTQRKSKDPLTAGAAVQELFDHEVPVLAWFDDGESALLSWVEPREDVDEA